MHSLGNEKNLPTGKRWGFPRRLSPLGSGRSLSAGRRLATGKGVFTRELMKPPGGDKVVSPGRHYGQG